MIVEEAVARSGVDQTRSRILAATRELYASKGSRGTTTREVAVRAGVNEATLFRHFKTKGQLLSDMLDHYSAVSTLPRMMERVRTFATIDAQLRELALCCIESLKRREDLIRMTMAEEASNPDATTCAWQAPTVARAIIGTFFEEKVAARELHGDGQALARIFMSLFFAYVMARKIWGDVDVPVERSVAQIVDVFLHGARGS
ncbi:MAG: TetR/AcrR family transcriptional regulator [Vulcanimicrobiaceae bacterium]